VTRERDDLALPIELEEKGVPVRFDVHASALDAVEYRRDDLAARGCADGLDDEATLERKLRRLLVRVDADRERESCFDVDVVRKAFGIEAAQRRRRVRLGDVRRLRLRRRLVAHDERDGASREQRENRRTELLQRSHVSFSHQL
jgi:hypothetical protein